MSNPFSAESDGLSLPATVPNRHPFGGKKRLHNVVRLRFKASFLAHWYDAGVLDLTDGDCVIAETSRGPAVGQIVGEVQRRVVPMGSLKAVDRKASSEDLESSEVNQRDEREALKLALGCIRERNLSMKLVQVHYMHDRSKAIFYFSAEGRIDFRGLVKDLAADLRMRIEMRQIGARDGARMIGGIGPCGRELCCSTFLENFSPVSIRMAKDQGLTLNPKKVSGMCGRLMCCLVYEQQVYASARRRLPRHGKPVATAQGLGTIKSVDVLQETVAVYLDEGKLETYAVADVVVLSPKQVEKRRELAKTEQQNRGGRRGGRRGEAGEDEYLWTDESKSGGRRRRGRGAASDGEKKPSRPEASRPASKKESKPRRERAERPAKPSERPPKPSERSPKPSVRPPKPAETGDEAAAGEGASTRRRRRRRGGRTADGSSAEGGSSAASPSDAPTVAAEGSASPTARPEGPRPEASEEGAAETGDGAPRKRRRRRRRRKPEGGADRSPDGAPRGGGGAGSDSGGGSGSGGDKA